MPIKTHSGGFQQWPGRIVSMVAKFSSVCKCGSFIDIGDTMSYDTLSRKSLCYVCVRKQLEFGHALSDLSEPAQASTALQIDKANPLIDRFRELRLSARPVSELIRMELKEILCRFKNEFGSSEQVRAFVSEIAKCRHSGAQYCPIKARFSGACIHCKETSTPGELVLYDHHARRIHCLICDCMRGL